MRRIFIEKKQGQDIEAQNLGQEISRYLKIKDINSVKMIAGYDIEGADKNQIEAILWKAVAGSNSDIVTMDEYETGNAFFFLTKLVPGQFDQQADFLQQLINLSYPELDVVVQSFKLFVIDAKLTQQEKARIKDYYINPIENREVPIGAPASIKQDYAVSIKDGLVQGFENMQEAELLQTKESLALGMGLVNLVFSRDYFKKEGKTPTVTELKILDTYWSDHCRHSTFQTVLQSVDFADENGAEKQAFDIFMAAHNRVYAGKERPLCLMDMATLKMKEMKQNGSLTDLEKSDEVNACSILRKVKVDGEDKDYIVMFKNETHNHPTEIEPFGGASTCLGGGIRDPLSGRSKVFASMRITGCANPLEAYENTLDGKLPQRKITTKAADGYSGYSNQIGLAGNYLQEYYHDGFKAKRMECGGLVAAVPQENVLRENGVAGDVILLIGGKTGRDGCGGATGSSKVQDKDSLEKSGAEVQKGNPYAQRGIVRLFANPVASRLIKKCNDFGAGGISVAVGELADGLDINLDVVPTKYAGLSGTELAISESQERMAVLISPENLEEFLAHCVGEDVEVTHIANVTDSGRVEMRFNGEVIADLDSAFLNSGGVRETATVKVAAQNFAKVKDGGDLLQKWQAALQDLNVASKKPIANQFDFSVGGTAAFAPFGGKNMQTPEQGLAVVIPTAKGNTTDGVIMTVGYSPTLGEQSCFHAGVYSVIEAVSKLVSMGGRYEDVRLSQQEYFESLSKNPEKWGKPFAALLGAFLVEEQLNIPAIGGKDSMSGTFHDISVPPTLITFAVNTVDTKQLVSKAFKKAGSKVVLLKTKINADGLPDFDEYKRNMQAVSALAKSGKILASSVVGAGGIAAEITQMCFGNNIGFKLADTAAAMFQPQYTDFILEVAGTDILETLQFCLLGETISLPEIQLADGKLDLNTLGKKWQAPLKEVFVNCETGASKEQKLVQGGTVSAAKRTSGKSPIVLIPVFKSTTGEAELEKMFKQAGAQTKIFVFKSLGQGAILASCAQLAEEIKKSDIIALPAVCQPENQSIVKMIFLQKDVMEATNALLADGGLVLGMGDNFKAIAELGLIDKGQITPDFSSPITVAQNRSGKLFSGLLKTNIISAAKPFFANTQNEPEILPFAVTTANVKIEEEALANYLAKGQIVSVYETPQEQDDLIGQAYNIDGMVSESGQVFARLANFERVDEGLYTNIAKQQKSNIFKNIVDYFAG